MGRLLNSNLCNAGVLSEAKLVLDELGYDLDELLNEEHDMGLGNGGLGRLAACFLDSMATMDLPAIGYGIHYQFGLFRQSFESGRQVEKPDDCQLRESLGNCTPPVRTEGVSYMGMLNTAMTTWGITDHNGQAIRK